LKAKTQKTLLDDQKMLNSKIKTLTKSIERDDNKASVIDDVICTPQRWESTEKNNLTGFKEIPKEK